MEIPPNLEAIRSPLGMEGSQVYTSTPLMKSDIGRKLIKKQFQKNIKNMSQEIESLELVLEGLQLNSSEKVDDHSRKELSTVVIKFALAKDVTQIETKVFVFNKEQEDSPCSRFITPKSISPDTIEKYNKLFAESPKLKRKRIRL